MNEMNPARPRAWTTDSPPVDVYQPREEVLPIEESVFDIEQTVTLWGDMVLRLARCKTGNHPDAEDIAQTVFMKLCQRQRVFESNEHLRAWLLHVTLTCSIDRKRDPWNTHQIKTDGSQEALEQLPQVRDTLPFCDAEPVLRETSVADAVATLPEKQRIVVHLHYFEDCTIKEIASITGDKPSTIRSYLHRARASLKTLIGGIHE